MFNEFMEDIGWVLVKFILVMMFFVIVISYFTSCKKIEVYNRINNTHWSCSDFFWAGEQINIQTQTINLNNLNK